MPAEHVLAAARTVTNLAALAREFSDGPSGPRGGDLGNFAPGRMVKPFSDATLKLKIGQVSDPVESDFGYHVILRKKVAAGMKASHVLIQFKGSARAADTVTRTKEDALKLATDVAKQAQAKDADFAALAKKYSDGPSGPDGGSLGVFMAAQMIPEFSAATEKMKIGEVSEPVLSDFGYHIIRREALPRKIRARHILVQYKGSERAAATVTRTKEEAKTRIDKVVGKLKAGDDFAKLAMEYSDGPSGPRGGDLEEFSEGVMHPAFNDAAFKLKVKGTSGIVETPFGYHVIYRYK
ncbi:peptidyl-prolyl cis-trans isomerase [bacterium]|nr:peptidyl-prolyl cis-trans isomerase [bacterium]